MTRPYRLGRREQTVNRNRSRVLAAARRLFARAGYNGAGLEEVALQAGVSRKTVYYQFGSKLGLLEALATELETAAGIPERIERIMQAPTREALRHYFADVCRFWSQNQDIVRAMQGLAATDSDARQVDQRHDRSRRARLANFVELLARRGELRQDYPPEIAVSLLWLLSSFSSFDHLVGRSHLSVSDAAAILADAAATIVSPGLTTQ